jgi:predicted permease
MNPLRQDVPYALRALRRAPGFTAMAVLTLGLGIGANTAIFSLVHAVLLKPLPFRDPSRLIAAWDSYLPRDKTAPAFARLGLSPREYEALSQQTAVFAETGWYRSVPLDMSLSAAGGEALTVHAAPMSPNLPLMLGVAPALGGSAGDGEALISDQLWRARFGADPGVIGRPIRLSDTVYTIAGVMPPNFRFPDWAEVWLPPAPAMGDEATNPVRHAMGFVGRLRPDVTRERAAAQLDTVAQQLAVDNPKTSAGWSLHAAGLQDDLTAKIRPTLLILLGAVALVLLIACSNVANLLLARATGRTKEIAVRCALGASAGRIARQLITESVVLGALGGGVGLAIGEAGLRALSPIEAPLDATVLMFLLAVSVVTGAVFGLAPALQSLRWDPAAAIKSAVPAGGGFGALRASLVAAEFALALILASGAGLLVKSFERLVHVDPGFDPRGLVTMRVSFPASRNIADLFHRVEERVRRLPGVDGFAATNALPLTTGHGNSGRFVVPDSPLIRPDSPPAAELRFVSPGYFHTMRIPLLRGREFTNGDLNASVVVINQEMANRFWPGVDPVGRKFITGPWTKNPTWSTIVGVAGDVKQFGLDSDPSLDIYYPALYPASIIVHAAGGAASLKAAVRRAVQEVAPDLPVSEVRTMEEAAAESARTRRSTMALLTAFAGLALVLAVIGVYGVMSWSVAQRTREIGIRMALGAERRDVAGMVVRYGLRVSAIGMAAGLAGAWALRRILETMVFEVSTSDWTVYGCVAAVMLLAALMACYLPARRAAKVDPLTALRWE